MDTEPESRPVPLWLRCARWAFALVVIVGALLLPVFLTGVRLHVHPWTAWRGTAVPEAEGLWVRIDPGLAISARTVLEVGGTGLLNTPRTQSVAATASELAAGGTRVVLASPDAEAGGWRVTFDFLQDGATVTRAAAVGAGDAFDPGVLAGTVLVNTLDWRSEGEKRCVFALHGDDRLPLCFRGSFALER